MHFSLLLLCPLSVLGAPWFHARQVSQGPPIGIDIGSGLAVPIDDNSHISPSTKTVTRTETETIITTAIETRLWTKTVTSIPTPVYTQVNAPDAEQTSVLFLPPFTPRPSSTVHKPIVAAYYPDWAASSLMPEQIDFDRFDWIDFAFALPNATFGLSFTQGNSEELLFRLVAAAHAKKKFAKLSIGGWTGSAHFSTAVSTPENRETFVSSIVTAVTKFGLDGIDLDWEYPGVQGNPGNAINPQDGANYLTFLRLLREKLPHGAKITAATQVWPFADDQGRPMQDVRAFAEVLDWILLMNYDVWGSSAHPGPNAPLNDGCNNSSQPMANAHAAIRSWTSAGFPAHQLTLGVPSYGYISRSSAQMLHNRHRRRGNAPIRVQNDDGGSDSGQVQFKSMIGQGVLVKDGDDWVGAGGFERRWDECSSTPFLRSESQGQIITYDDPVSLTLKADLAYQSGLLGVNMFDAHGDTAEWELIDSVRRGLRIIE